MLDGGFGTLIEQRSGQMIGLKSYCWGAAFLKEDPALVQSNHHDYMKAGADIITTSTFKASVNGFAEIGVDEKEAFDLCVKSARLGRTRPETSSGPTRKTGRAVYDHLSLHHSRPTVEAIEDTPARSTMATIKRPTKSTRTTTAG